jgi:hypothetical protein
VDTQEYFFQCPYCWQTISMVLDLSVSEQKYVEDCEGCCAPIAIRYQVADRQVAVFEAAAVQR